MIFQRLVKFTTTSLTIFLLFLVATASVCLGCSSNGSSSEEDNSDNSIILNSFADADDELFYQASNSGDGFAVISGDDDAGSDLEIKIENFTIDSSGLRATAYNSSYRYTESDADTNGTCDLFFDITLVGDDESLRVTVDFQDLLNDNFLENEATVTTPTESDVDIAFDFFNPDFFDGTFIQQSDFTLIP